MADKKLSAVEELTEAHRLGIARRKRALEEAMNDLNAAEQMVKDAKLTIAQIQQANLTASLAYDDQVAALRNAPNKAA
jgi:hypothetical protein